MLRHVEVRADFVELHGFDARGLVLARLDHAVLDRVVDLVVGDHRRRHAGGAEGLAPDRGSLHTDLETPELRHVAHGLVGEDVPGATAGEADQHDVGFRGNLVGYGLQRVGIEHLVPVIEIAKQERRIDERGGFRERRHVRRRDDAVVDRDALVHVGEIVLLQAQLTILVQHEVDRLAVVLLDQFLEFHEGFGERMIVVELDRAVQCDRLLCGGVERKGQRHDSGAARERLQKWMHRFLQQVACRIAAGGRKRAAPHRGVNHPVF